jgi:N-acetylglucosaminyldiphosphoundecaprenol N-acetyl-beta-D-mannosaminyltransferase
MQATSPPSADQPSAAAAIPRTNVLGVGVSAINMQLAIECIDGWIATRTPNYVCVTGVHGVMESQHDPSLRDIHNGAGLVTPDGMPLVWLSRWSGKQHVSRVYGPDLMLALCEHSVTKGYRHFFYGGVEGVAEQLTEALSRRFPNLQTVGTITPPFRALTEAEDTAIVEQIQAAQPDIVFGVGAAFDFHTGRKPQAPRWMQRNGFEWMFRLASEPRRLWKRYLVGNTLFVFHTLLQTSGIRRYPLRQSPPRSPVQ